MPVTDINRVVLTGENPFIRLSEKDGDPNTTDASYWRILFSLGFLLLQMLFSRFAAAFKLDFRLAYALPPVIMLAVSAWLFNRRSS